MQCCRPHLNLLAPRDGSSCQLRRLSACLGGQDELALHVALPFAVTLGKSLRRWDSVSTSMNGDQSADCTARAETFTAGPGLRGDPRRVVAVLLCVWFWGRPSTCQG